MATDRTGHPVSSPTVSSGRFLTDGRLRLFFFLLLAATTAARVLLSIFPKTAVTYNDELFYLEIAQNLWRNGSVSVYSAPIRFTKILYSVLIAPFYAVEDGILRTQLISGFNALLLSSSLIPGWLLARRILKRNGYTALALLLLAFSPNLLFSMTFMAECLFYPLMMWGFLLLYRFLSAEKPSPLQALLLGFWAFLLYLTKESGAAFLFSLILVLTASRRFASLLPALAGFGLPTLALRLIVFRGLHYTYAHQASPANITTSSQLMYLLYGSGILLLFFLASCLWFPVAVPLIRRKKLLPRDRYFLLFAVGLSLAVAVGTAFGVLLYDKGPTAFPRIHLRYFLTASWPFLLLFFACFETKEAPGRKPLLISTILFALSILIFFFIPVRSSLVDSPLLDFFDLIPKDSAAALWLCKAGLVLLTAAMLLLLLLNKQKGCAAVLSVSMMLLSFAGSGSFIRSAREEEEITDGPLTAEVLELNDYLAGFEGNTLIIVPSLFDSTLKLVNTVSRQDYAVIVQEEAEEYTIRQCAAERPNTQGSFPLDPHDLHVPYPEFSVNGNYDLETVDYLVLMDSWQLFDSSLHQDITPEWISRFHIYRSLNPSVINLVNPFDYSLGDTILFNGEYPSLRYYQPEGFSYPESGFTWSGSTEVSLTICPRVDEPRDLTVRWNWRMVLGEQPCEIYANDMPVVSEVLTDEFQEMSFQVPASSYADTGLLTLRFVFPEASEPGNGDTRVLAVAFESLTLE